MNENNPKAEASLVAHELHQARLQALPVSQLSERYSGLTRSLAYDIQAMGIQLRIAQGEQVVGLKMGLTSKAKRDQMNLDSPLYGVLTDKMQIFQNGSFSLKGSIHPKIEPEIAFHINKELKGKVGREDVWAACDGVYAALEILDSRYKQFKYFSMEDVIADNSSSSHFILGDKITDFKSINLANLKLEMRVNGKISQEGNSSAISGDPVNSVIELCELLADRDESLPANTIVLAGAATLAVALEPGMQVELKVEQLGKVNVNIVE